MELGAAAMESSKQSAQKIKNRTIVCSGNSTSGYLSEEKESTNLKRYMHSSVHRSTIPNSQDTETARLLTDEHIKKPWYIHTRKYDSATKRRKFSSATTRMNFKGMLLREISRKKTSNLWVHLHVESKNTKCIETVAFMAARGWAGEGDR